MRRQVVLAALDHRPRVVEPQVGLGVRREVPRGSPGADTEIEHFHSAQIWAELVEKGLFRRLQLLSAAAYSLGHGGNDAQKTMGIIAGVLVAGGYLQLVNGEMPIPLWVILAAHAAIALGTLTGGLRIIHTMGSKITKLQPVGGFAAETAGAISLFTATHFGIPVSTTHTITGAIIGVGSIRRLSAVRWGIAGRIVWAWILTIPASAAIAALVYLVVVAVGGR